MKTSFDMNNGISVVMPVYNGGKTILYAVESILRQRFRNLELIIVDDGSSDDTCRIISDIPDNRIRLLRHEHDYIKSLNTGIHAARGKYIARMDADDYMHPDRLLFQWHFMEQHQNIDVCSTWMQTYGLSYTVISNVSGRLYNILYRLLSGNVICHPTVLMRRDRILENGLSYEDYPMAEDYKLWFEAAKKGLTFYVIPLVLHYYQQSRTQQSYKHFNVQKNTSEKIRMEILEYIMGKQSSKCLRKFLEDAIRMHKEGLMTLEEVVKLFLAHSSL
ncbi:MAG: glycosyltransferase family 2 protein [Bacteroidaceae bacterium]